MQEVAEEPAVISADEINSIANRGLIGNINTFLQRYVCVKV